MRFGWCVLQSMKFSFGRFILPRIGSFGTHDARKHALAESFLRMRSDPDHGPSGETLNDERSSLPFVGRWLKATFAIGCSPSRRFPSSSNINLKLSLLE